MSGTSELDHNPFVGPRPIQQGEPLHGRNTEVRELYHRLQARRIVVLHSPSGAGKSSLVSAGLIPLLHRDAFDVWKTIRINLDPASFEGVPEGANRYLLSALVSLEDELPAERRRSPAELARIGLREYLDTRPRRKSREKFSVVLLFDQFEEVLSVAPRNVEAKRAFFEALGEALDPGDYWALFIIREDYLAALEPYRDLIPTQLHNTFRLDLLGLEGARAAATNLSKQGGRTFIAVEKLIRDLSAVQVQQVDGTVVIEPGLHVEPVHLQVVCRRLWDAMPADKLHIYAQDLEAYAKVSTSLAGYYADAVTAIANGDVALERMIRDWVGTKLIVGGIRTQLRREPGKSAGLDNRHIEKLLDSYIVRTEQRVGFSWFELSHDRLVEPILEDNATWQQGHLHPLQVQAKLWEDGGHSHALLLDPDALPAADTWAAANPDLLTAGEREFLARSHERRDAHVLRRRGRRVFSAVLVAATIVAIGFGVLASQAQRESDDRRREAEEAHVNAEDARRQAVRARVEADDARIEAEGARAQAEQAKIHAEKTQKENERSVRQMFELALRPVTEQMIEQRREVGVVEIDERWTPLLARGDQAIVAATLGENVRIVVVGRESVLSEVGPGGRSLFLEIAAQWLLADQARRTIAIVPEQPDDARRIAAIERNLLRLSYQTKVAASLADADVLADVGMLILDNRQSPPFSEDEIATIRNFVSRGGGVLAVGHGRAWLEQQPSLDSYPMNAALAFFGARWSDAVIGPEQLEQREVPAVGIFENKLDVEVNLYVRNAEREELYTTLAPGQTYELLTEIGREWVFRTTADEREIDSVVIEDEEQILTIGATVAKTKPKPKPKPTPEPEPEVPRDEPVEETPTQLPDRLSSDDMQAGLAAARRAAKDCGSELKTLMSEATVQLTVNGDGKVERVDVLPPAKGTPEAACLDTALSRLGFPRSREGGEATWKLKLY